MYYSEFLTNGLAPPNSNHMASIFGAIATNGSPAQPAGSNVMGLNDDALSNTPCSHSYSSFGHKKPSHADLRIKEIWSS